MTWTTGASWAATMKAASISLCCSASAAVSPASGSRSRAVGLDVVGLEQLQRETPNATAVLADGDAPAGELIQLIDSLLAAIEDPHGLVGHAAERTQGAGFIVVVAGCPGTNPPLHESNVSFTFLEALEVLVRTRRCHHLERDAPRSQHGRIAPGIGIIGAGFAAGGDRYAPGRLWRDELIGDDETDCRDEDDRPCRRQHVTESDQPGTQTLHQGSRIVDPVCLRASRSRCAVATSTSG
jgi:hypothetical protein